jgi:hypothetical protein
MSWSTLSWFFVKTDRYEYSCGKASSSRGEAWDEESAVEIKLVKNEDVRRGIGSSGLLE